MVIGERLLVIELFRGEEQGARGKRIVLLSTFYFTLATDSKLYTLNSQL